MVCSFCYDDIRKNILREWYSYLSYQGIKGHHYGCDTMDLDSSPDPDYYRFMKRIKQLYVEFYKSKNIEKFRNTKISIERKVAA